ncbi:MAG TPA: hypothetical protein VF463_06030 [Sphingobium sp.]
MKLKTLPLVMAALTPLSAKAQPITIEDRALPYGCSDIVVVGRITNGEYTPVHDDDDIIGHGLIGAHIKVKRLLKGANLPSLLPIRYYAHTYMRDDRDFMFVLSGNGTDGFEIRHAQLMSVRPIISVECER